MRDPSFAGPRTWDKTMADEDVGLGTKAEDVGEGNVVLISYS